MKNSFLWITVPLLAVILCFETATGAIYVKAREDGSRPIYGHFCGDHIMDAYYTLCFPGKRKRRSTILEEKEALSFVRSLSSRSPRQADSGTDIVEECCAEGCALEEIFEYC